MKLIKLRRGDQALIGFPAVLNGELIDIEKVDKMEFVMGEKKWTWPNDGTYDDNYFFLPIMQEESFRLEPGTILPIEGRCKMKDTDVWVKGAETDVYVRVIESGSDTVFEAEEA